MDIRRCLSSASQLVLETTLQQASYHFSESYTGSRGLSLCRRQMIRRMAYICWYKGLLLARNLPISARSGRCLSACQALLFVFLVIRKPFRIGSLFPCVIYTHRRSLLLIQLYPLFCYSVASKNLLELSDDRGRSTRRRLDKPAIRGVLEEYVHTSFF